MSLNAASVASSIANLSISELRIKPLTDIPQIISPRDCPVMLPDTNYIRVISVTPMNVERGSNATFIVRRGLNYLVFVAEVGQGRGIFEHIPTMVSLVDSIGTAILSLDIADIDIDGFTVGNFGVIKDTNGKDYFGFTLEVLISEFANP